MPGMGTRLDEAVAIASKTKAYSTAVLLLCTCGRGGLQSPVSLHW